MIELGAVRGTVPCTTQYHPHHPLSYLHLAVYGRTMKLNSGLQGENLVCGSSA